METLLITRIVFSMLFVPFLMILGAILAVMLTFYALTIHPLLALLVFIGVGVVFVLAMKWESARIRRDHPGEPD